MNETVSCIIPAYNEGPRIRESLTAACGSRYVAEVIVVNDGSSDNTLEEIQKLSKNRKLKIVTYEKNRGKSFAFATGLEKSNGKIVLMLDSDLRGITGEHVNSLLEPIILDRADMAMSMRENSLGFYKFMGIDFISGERAFRRSVLSEADIEHIKGQAKFGLEVFINRKIMESGGKIAVIKWKGVSHARKAEKVGKVRGFFEEISMALQLVRSQGFFGLAHQLAKMKRALV